MPEEVFVAHLTRPGQFVFLQNSSPANAPRLHVVPEGAIGLCGKLRRGEHYIEEVLRYARRLKRFAALSPFRKLLSWSDQAFSLVLLAVCGVYALGMLSLAVVVPFVLLAAGDAALKYTMFVGLSIGIPVILGFTGYGMVEGLWDKDMSRSWQLLRRPPEGLRRSEIPPPGWKENA